MILDRFTIILVGLFVFAPAMLYAEEDTKERSRFIAGQFLVATPTLRDPNFNNTVIYMIGHDTKGAMGIVINRSFGSGPLSKLLEGFGVEKKDTVGIKDTAHLHYGGPVEPDRGFILHSRDYKGEGDTEISETVSLTTRMEILKAIAKGKGPKRILITLGYAGWGAGQLENEMNRGDWTTAPAQMDLLFSNDPKSVWKQVSKVSGTEL